MAARGHRRRRSPRRGLFLAAAALLAGRPVRAQGLDDLRLDSLTGFLKLEAEFVDESHETGSGTVEETEKSLRESLGLRARGFWYHPKLLLYEFGGEFGLEQRDIDSTGGRGRAVDDQNVFFDGRVRLFKDLAYSGEVYARRTETRTRQTFFETTEAVVQEQGVNLFAREWWIPTTVHAHHYDYSGRGAFDYQEDRDQVSLSGTRSRDRSQIQYRLELNRVDLASSGQSYDDVNASASTSFLFGDRKQTRWTTNGYLRDQSGTIDSRTSGLGSQLHIGLRANLASDTSVRLTRTELSGAKSDTTFLTSGLTHQLYQSLNTNLAGRISTTKADESDVHTVGGILQLNYRKKTPVGRLSIRYRHDYYIQDENSVGGPASVIDEAHVYQPGQILLLDQFGIDVTTIVVTDDTGLIVYTEGVDYVVTTVAGRVRLDIPPGSLISPGQTILVDYLYTPNPDLEFANLGRDLNILFTMPNRAELYLNYGTVDQSLRSGIDTGVLDDSTRKSAGVRGYIGDLTTGVEYESYDSRFVPFDRTRLYAVYDVPVEAPWTWRLDASTFRTTFPDESEDETGQSAGSSLTAVFGPSLRGSLRLEWRQIDYRTDAGQAWFAEAEVTRRWKALDFAFRAYYDDESFDVASDQRILRLLFSVSRRF